MLKFWIKWILSDDPYQAYGFWEEWFLKHNPDLEDCLTVDLILQFYEVPWWVDFLNKIIWFFPRLFGRINSPW